MNRSCWIATLLTCWLLVSGHNTWAQEKEDQAKEFMRAKLKHAQNLMEALTLENYDAMVKESQELDLLSQAATWQVMSTAEYLDHSKEFQRSAQAVNSAAKKRNLDGAALAYVEMTLKCVNCHKYVRRIRTAQLGPPLSQPVAAK